MIWLRKVFVHFLSIVLLVALVGTAASFGLNRDFANPSHLESWLAGSGIYNHVSEAVLQQAQKSNSDNTDSGTVSLSDPAVQQSVSSIFTPELIQQAVNTFLNGNYDWLSGKKAAPDFNIDLTSAKQNVAKLIGQATQAHLAGLPACSATQLAQLPVPVDPLTVTCRPSTLDPQAEGDRVAQEVNSNSNLLSNPDLTASSLGQNQPALSGVSNPPPPTKPYYKKLSWAPTAYQIGLKLPWALGALALLCMAGIVFISIRRRKGVRRIGIVFALAGLILIGMKFLADAGVSKLSDMVVKNATLAGFKQPVSDFLQKVEPQLVRNYVLSGVVFIVIAALVFLLLFRSRQQAIKPAKQAALSESEPAEAQSTVSATGQDQLTASPASADEGLASRLQPAAPALGPLGKNPPRRKPPKLIQ